VVVEERVAGPRTRLLHTGKPLGGFELLYVGHCAARLPRMEIAQEANIGGISPGGTEDEMAR
jgi:hypothetical protein